MCRCPLSREEQPGTRGTHTDREAGESEREGWGDARSAPAWSVQQGAHGWVGEPCVETSGVGFQRDNQESLPAQRAKNQDQPGSRRTEEGALSPAGVPKLTAPQAGQVPPRQASPWAGVGPAPAETPAGSPLSLRGGDCPPLRVTSEASASRRTSPATPNSPASPACAVSSGDVNQFKY